MNMAHSYSQIYIHAVWAVKNRESLLIKQIRFALFKHIFKRIKQEGIIVAFGGVEDHVHCLFILPTSKTVADIIKIIKGESSSWLNGSALIDGVFKWQTGYSAFSVSPQRVEKIKQYIFNQEQHHQTVSYDEEVKFFEKS